MKSFVRVLLSLSVLFFLTACSNDTKPNETYETYEVNGPGGAYVGATEFVPAMLAGQTIYTYNDHSGLWIGITFAEDGTIHYQNIHDLDYSTDYSIQEGAIVVNDGERDPVIHLVEAQAITWSVDGADNDGRKWQDDWHLQLKFKPEMIVGKSYLSEYNNRGEHIAEKLYFTETTLEVTTPEGEPKDAFPYRLENGTIIATKGDGEFTLNLMFPEGNGSLSIWYASVPENYANNSTWSPINE